MIYIGHILYLNCYYFWRGNEAKTSPQFLWHFFFFFNLMEEEFCTKFYGVLISFHEVIKLLKWHTRECMKYFTSPLFFYMFLLILLERTFWCFDHFWRTYRVKVTSSKQVNINNMLIVVSKQTFWKFSLMPFWWKALFLAKVVTLT